MCSVAGAPQVHASEPFQGGLCALGSHCVQAARQIFGNCEELKFIIVVTFFDFHSKGPSVPVAASEPISGPIPFPTPFRPRRARFCASFFRAIFGKRDRIDSRPISGKYELFFAWRWHGKEKENGKRIRCRAVRARRDVARAKVPSPMKALLANPACEGGGLKNSI